MKKTLMVALLLFAVLLSADIPPLTGTGISSSYKQLMLVENATGSTNVGLSGTLQEFMDGAGQSSGLYISKAASQTDKIALQFDTLHKLSFRDAGLLIFSSLDGKLDIDADLEAEIGTATLDIDVTSGLTIDGALTDIGGGTYATANGDNDLGIAGDLEVDGKCDFDGSVDIDGDTALDNVDIVGTFEQDAGNATFNEAGANYDFRVESLNNTHMLFIDGSADYIGINNSTPSAALDVTGALEVSSTTTLSGAVTMSSTASVIGLTDTGTTTITTADINGGAIDATTIGSTTATTGRFSVLTFGTNGSMILNGAGYIAMDGTELLLDDDRDTGITADTDDRIDIEINGADALHIDATTIYPETDGAIDLGRNGANEFGSIYLKDDVDCEGDLNVGTDATITGALDVDGATSLDNTGIEGTFKWDGTTFDLNGTDDITIDTSDTTDGVKIATVTSGVPVSIGHTTSETTVNDNLNVTGGLTVDAMSMIVGFNFANSDTGTDTYTAILAPALTSYVTGLMVILSVTTNNVGACSLNLNSLGAKDIKISGTLANPSDDDINSDGMYILIYDGTQFQLINPS